MINLHTVFSKTPSVIISKPESQGFISLDNNEEINNSAYDLLLRHLIKGLRNYSGNLSFEKHRLTWEFRTGEEFMPMLHSEIDNIVTTAINEFSRISQVKNITYNCIYEDKKVLFNIFVDMPEYDDVLMSNLAKTEVRVTKMAGAKGYIFNYEYFPA